MTRKVASTNWFPETEVESVAPRAAVAPEPEPVAPGDTSKIAEVATSEGPPEPGPTEPRVMAQSPQAELINRILETLDAAAPVAPRAGRAKRLPKTHAPLPTRRPRPGRAGGRSAPVPTAAVTRPKAPVAPRPDRRRRSLRAERRRARKTWRKVVSLALFAVVVGAWFVTLRPTSLGGPASVLTVRGVSMQPSYQYGDIIIAHERSDYRPGDIIAFRVPEGEVGAGAVVIHRIIGGDATTGFITQGDNNPDPDEWRPVPTDILGAARWRIPALGRMMAGLRTGPGIALVAGALAALIVIFGSESPRQSRTDGRRRQPETPDEPQSEMAFATMTAELHSDVAVHREAPETDPDPQTLDPVPVAANPREAADSDPLDDLIVPPPLLPVASPEPIASEAAPLPSAELAPDPVAYDDGSEDDVLSMDLHLGPRPRPRATEADDYDPSPVGEYWGDLDYLAGLLRPKQDPVLFDDELEPVAAPTLRALD